MSPFICSSGFARIMGFYYALCNDWSKKCHMVQSQYFCTWPEEVSVKMWFIFGHSHPRFHTSTVSLFFHSYPIKMAMSKDCNSILNELPFFQHFFLYFHLHFICVFECEKNLFLTTVEKNGSDQSHQTPSSFRQFRYLVLKFELFTICRNFRDSIFTTLFAIIVNVRMMYGELVGRKNNKKAHDDRFRVI